MPHLEKAANIPKVIAINQDIARRFISSRFFNRVSQGSPGNCDAGALLYLNSSHMFYFKYGVGIGSNNRAEFFALWILLIENIDKGLGKLQALRNLS